MSEEDFDHRLLSFRVETLESAVGEIKIAVKSIDESLKALTRLDVHHQQTSDAIARAFQEIGKLDDKIDTMALQIPMLKQSSGWVTSAGQAVVMAVIMAIVYTVLR